MDVMHPTYMPFSEEQLRARFYGVDAPGTDPERHLQYYRRSLSNLARLESGASSLTTAQGRQVEKDERFWTAAAFLGAWHAADRAQAFEELLSRALGGGQPCVLEDPLELWLEANLSSPASYRGWLRDHLSDRLSIPYLAKAANRRGVRLEGATHVDAVLHSPQCTVLFEAKVLSDISSHTTYDELRNQLARNIDVALEPPSPSDKLLGRNAESTFVVLVTPRRFKRHRNSRLYGALFDEYRADPNCLRRDLPHRPIEQLDAFRERLGWLTWEDFAEVIPGACEWLSS